MLVLFVRRRGWAKGLGEGAGHSLAELAEFLVLMAVGHAET